MCFLARFSTYTTLAALAPQKTTATACFPCSKRLLAAEVRSLPAAPAAAAEVSTASVGTASAFLSWMPRSKASGSLPLTNSFKGWGTDFFSIFLCFCCFFWVFGRFQKHPLAIPLGWAPPHWNLFGMCQANLVWGLGYVLQQCGGQ